MNELKDNMKQVKHEQDMLYQLIADIDNLDDLSLICSYIRSFIRGFTGKRHYKNEWSETSND